MARKPTYEELEQKVKQLEGEVRGRKGIEDALKDYIAYQSVLAVLRGVPPEQTEDALLQTFLSEIVKQYGFCMSWYGQYSSGEIRPILSAGRVDRYLDNLVLEITEPTSPDAQCAMSQAILSRSPFSYADLERDEGFRQWRDYALELGYRSNLALPLKVDGLIEGGIMVYADTPKAFPKERIERLQLLTLEMGAILHGRRHRQKAEEALQKAHDELEQRVEERTAELVKANEQLKREIEERKQMEEKLRKSEEKLDAMLRSIGDHMSMMDKDLSIIWANEIATRVFGNDIIGKKCFEVYHRRKAPCEPYPCLTLKAFQDGKTHEHDTQVIDKDGKILHFHCTANVALRDREGKPTAVIEISRDITEQKRGEESLRKREAELEAQSHHLSEVNTALKILLKQREEDKRELEENVLSNVKQLVSSHLERLKESRLDADQTTLVSILESNLSNIVSPFISRLSSKFLHLTPMEIRVADLIKEGKTNKEIGALLSLSPNTVKFHRYNLRSKLGLKNKKMNLRTHLLSLAK